MLHESFRFWVGIAKYTAKIYLQPEGFSARYVYAAEMIGIRQLILLSL